jgi:hypothetical protein
MHYDFMYFYLSIMINQKRSAPAAGHAGALSLHKITIFLLRTTNRPNS